MSDLHRVRVGILVGGLGLGGAERQLHNLLKYADKERFELHVLVLNQDPHFTYEEAIRRMGVEVWKCPESHANFPRRLSWLTGILRQIKAEVAHSWVFYANVYVGLAGRLAGVPVRIGSVRSQPELYQTRFSLLHRQLSYCAVGEMVVNSERARDKLKRDPRVRRVHLVRNGVDLDSDSENVTDVDLASFGIEKKHRIVATVGNLRRNKNQKMLVDAMSLVVPHFHDVRCMIVGQPIPDEEKVHVELQSRIDELGLSGKVVLAGVRDDVQALMKRFSVFTLTSYNEGSPNTIVEAMAAGCPVVSTDVGGVPYILKHVENGFLVAVDDSEALAGWIIKLLSDAELARRIGDAGRKTVESRFSAERMAREMEQVYLDTLQARASSAFFQQT